MKFIKLFFLNQQLKAANKELQEIQDMLWLHLEYLEPGHESAMMDVQYRQVFIAAKRKTARIKSITAAIAAIS